MTTQRRGIFVGAPVGTNHHADMLEALTKYRESKEEAAKSTEQVQLMMRIRLCYL